MQQTASSALPFRPRIRPLPPLTDQSGSAPEAEPRTRSGFFPARRARPRPLDASADDATLVRAAWAGDPRAHVAIWRKYGAMVRSKMSRSVGGRDVEDHAQEVFLRLFEYLPELRDPAALRSFIIGIALRVAGTELRRRRCRWWLTLTATGDLPESPRSWTDDGSDVREVLARLLAILDKLTPHSARVFELRYVEEKELAEVAHTLGISLATAKRHLARASARVFAMAEREPAVAGFVHGGSLRPYSESAAE